MDGMADTVSGAAVPDPKLLTGAAQKEVIIGILKIGLQQVVIDILGRKLRPDTRQLHGLELQHHQRSCGILRERLVDREADLRAHFHPALDEMAGDQFLRKVLAHHLPLLPFSRSAGALTIHLPVALL
jgi:hypothetical protein